MSCEGATPLHTFDNLFARVRRLWPQARGRFVQFKAPSEAFLKYAETPPVLMDVVLDAGVDGFDEGDLPLFVLHFADGHEFAAPAELIATDDPAVEAAIAAAWFVFEEAARMGFDGPNDLRTRGSQAQHAQYLSQVRRFISARNPPAHAANDDGPEGMTP